MIFSVQLFERTAISLGSAANLGNYRLKPISKLSPRETKVSEKSCSLGAV